MDIINTCKNEYNRAIRDLFPRGEYWDRQFENPESDCSLFCKAKTAELFRLRKLMAALQKESVIQTAEETLEDWERVFFNKTNKGLNPDQRRFLLFSSKKENITAERIKQMGLIYGIDVTKVEFPFKPAFFGFSSFGTDRLASPAAFSVLFISIAQSEHSNAFEKKVLEATLNNHIVFFYYGGS